MEVKRPIKPEKVVEEYARRHGGPVHLREIIAQSLREGKIRGRAYWRGETQEPSLIKAWQTVPKQGAGRKSYKSEHDIDRATWWRSISWAEDILNWDFSQSRMHVTLSADPSVRLLFSHVRFYENDVRNVLGPSTFELPNITFNKVARKDEWRRFWHEIVLKAAGGIDELQAAFSKSSSDDAIAGELLRTLRLEDELVNTINASDEDIARILRHRHKFRLEDSTLIEEVKNLRQTLKLKRQYIRRKPAPR